MDVTFGLDAVNALSDEGTGGNGTEFTSFKSGVTLKVKVLSTQDLSTEYVYGIYNQVNSFAADTPSKKSAKGYPIANYTAWDKAWKYHKDLSEDWNDEHGQEAGKYRAKQRFAFGFIDLETGEPIIIDLSKKQAQTVYPVIRKNENRLNKKYFEISKQGSGTSTVVMMSAEDIDELNATERKHFDNAPEKFDEQSLKDVWVRKNEEEQVELLVKAGFDISLIGYGTKQADNSPEQAQEPPKADEEPFELDDPTSQF